MEFFAAQVKEAVFQAQFFRSRNIIGNREGHRLGGTFNGERCYNDFNLARRQVRIDGFGRAFNHGAFNANDGFHAQMLDLVKKPLMMRLNNKLRNASVVAQVNENQAPMVAFAMNPTGKFDGFGEIGFAKVAAKVRAILCRRRNAARSRLFV
jgi:hypothetical protein